MAESSAKSTEAKKTNPRVDAFLTSTIHGDGSSGFAFNISLYLFQCTDIGSTESY